MDSDESKDELDPITYAHIESLIDSGDKFQESGEYDRAIAQYQRAIDLVPDPICDWDISTTLLTALGETYFLQREYERAHDTLAGVMYCPNALGNPYIHLKLGQTQFELGNMRRAKDELVRAYMGAGKEIFDDEDPKYFDLVKGSITL